MTRWTALKQVVHKLVGARGSTSVCAGFDQFQRGPSPSSTNFGHVYTESSFLKEVSSNRLVFIGEIHSMGPIVALQQAIQEQMSEDASLLHVVFEHFSFEMQQLLRDYQDGALDFDGLVAQYRTIGTENHNLEPYRPLLEHGKTHKDEIKLHAGFLPRSFARMLMKEGEEVTFEAASQWLPPNPSLEGSEFHYNLFESLISGRPMYQEEAKPPSDRFRGIFKAQLLKDISMANKVNQLLDTSADEKEKILVIAGNGHVMHYCGVPERVLSVNPGIASQTCLVVSHPSIANIEDEAAVQQDLEDFFGPSGTNPGDYIYVFKDDYDDGMVMEAAAKAESKSAYDKVGESAHLKGSMKKAKAMMAALGYTDEQFDIAGPDAYNFQGVGNPHLLAKIQPGERVLDVGSGLGVDSFIASHSAGTHGKVVGIDISSKEVEHAQLRAANRGADIQFAVADMENIPVPDNTFDVVISNGAFCLTPNKEKSFAEILRVLKPGGRMSVCTSTIKDDKLQSSVNWPLCMRMFIPQKDILPMCEKLGFSDVLVDDSDSSMTVELPEEALEETNPDRNRVHVGSDEFKHLESYDMDEICARVCVVARKPE